MILNHIFEKSAMLSNASYDTEEKEMLVTFQNGRTYTYIDVDLSMYEELIGSASVGRHFNSIKSGLKQKQKQ